MSLPDSSYWYNVSKYKYMAKNIIRTHRRITSIASHVLRHSTSKKLRSLAGEALSNRRKSTKR